MVFVLIVCIFSGIVLLFQYCHPEFLDKTKNSIGAGLLHEIIQSRWRFLRSFALIIYISIDKIITNEKAVVHFCLINNLGAVVYSTADHPLDDDLPLLASETLSRTP